VKRNAEEIESLLRELSSHGLGGLNPDAGQLRALIEADRNGPLQFLNLLRYRDSARYPPGHDMAERNLSGADAYALYGAVALRHVGQRGGCLTLLNDVEQDIIGDGAGWDQIAIMEYPSTDAFLDMVRDLDYTAALVHRDAGLEKTVVLVTRPLLPPAA
jgi:uncharacterized protein (DUF1330 family)